MSKIKAAILKLTAKLSTNEKAQEVAGNRWLANHERAIHNHKEQKEAEREATKAHREAAQLAREEKPVQSEHKSATGDQLDQKASRCKVRAFKSHKRATFWVAQAKVYARKVHHLEESINEKEDRLHKIEIEHGPRIDPDNPNKVIGGTAKARDQFAMHYSMLHGAQYYSQTGPTTVKQGLTGPTSGHRHDCSSWFTSISWSCGFPDPNGGPEYIEGETVYTGTIGVGGKPIFESELDTGDAILFGTAPFHHVERKDGPMSEGSGTVGHGSDAIDRGVVALLPGPRAYRRLPTQ